MKTSKVGLNLIKKFEGFESKAYMCPAGYYTIGYGHLITSGQEFLKSMDITEKQAEVILMLDVRAAETAVNRNVKVPITQPMFDALVSFTYNLGGGNLKTSTLLKFVNRKNFEAASKEFMRWVNAGGVKLEGLVKRREEEKKLFISGI